MLTILSNSSLKAIKLSGGQRQRIAIARAILKNAPILILDEPTAMFDPEAERRFVEDARAALAGRSVILITHRPASLELADVVVRLADGRIVEERACPETSLPNLDVTPFAQAR